jgi:hypothetical protein
MNYSQNNKGIEKPKSPTQRSGSVSTYNNNTPTYYENASATNATPASSTSYITNEAQMAHTQTPYPAATQYSTYGETPPSTIAYTPQDTASYAAYPSNSETVEAPLLAAFAAQASQVQAQNQGSNWQRSPHLATSGSLAWQQWTNTMAGTLEPQDCYSASALMQLGGRELGEGQVAPNSQASAALNAMTINSQNGVGHPVNMEQNVGNIGGPLGSQVSGGVTWPLNIFDIGQSGTS